MEEEISLRRFLRACYMVIVYQIIGNIIQGIVSLIFVKGITGQGEDIWEQSKLQYNRYGIIVTLIAAVITIPICFYLYKRDRKEEQLGEQGEYQRISVKKWILIIILGSSSCIALNNWISLSGIMKIFSGFEKTAQVLYGGNLMIEVLTVGVAAPIVEEFLFRGLFYKRVTKMINKKVAGLLSALFFGIYHFNVVQGIYAFLIGILLVYLYEKFQTLKAPVLFHMAANMTSVLFTEFQIQNQIQVGISEMILSAVFATIITGVILFFFERK